ncbi:MAG: division/cell wall cluster transcriptional repressor MraZ [Calditrichia bacterium]
MDSKGRINIPAKYRPAESALGGDDNELVITRGTDHNLVIFPLEEWRRINDEIDRSNRDGKEKRRLKRQINFFASLQKIDKQGRLNIPADLIEYAGLEKEVVVLGTGRKIEVWNPDRILQDIESSQEELGAVTDSLDF